MILLALGAELGCSSRFPGEMALESPGARSKAATISEHRMSLPTPAESMQATRGSEIKLPTWNQLKQTYIVVGREIEQPNGDVRVEFEAYDVAKKESLLGAGLAITGPKSGLRDVALQVADIV